MGLNGNQIAFVVIFALLALILVLLTYVCWLRRIKVRAKQEILAQQQQIGLSQQQQINYDALTASQLQELKPVLLQKLYGNQHTTTPPYPNPFEDTPQYSPPSRDEHTLVNINDDSERDATIIHTGTDVNRNTDTTR